MVVYGRSNNNGYRYILAVFDYFSKYRWCIPLKNEYAQTKKDQLSNIIGMSKRKHNLIETDDRKECVNKIFNGFRKVNDNKRYSRYTSNLLDMAVYGRSNNKGYRYILAVFDYFSKYRWCIPFKIEYAQTKKDQLSNIIGMSKRKHNLIETDDRKECVNKTFKGFRKVNDIKRYSRYTSK